MKDSRLKSGVPPPIQQNVPMCPEEGTRTIHFSSITLASLSEKLRSCCSTFRPISPSSPAIPILCLRT